MFKLQKIEQIRWPVEVRIPRDGGKTTRATFHCMYRVLEQPEIDELTRESANDAEFLARVIVDWEGVMDAHDQSMPCTPDNIATLCRVVYVRQAMLSGFFRAQSGATEKN